MSNADTEREGLQAVIEYEKQQGRIDIQRVQKAGFDLITKGLAGERHIEVKATVKLVSHFDGLSKWNMIRSKMIQIFIVILSQTLQILHRDEYGSTTKSVQWLGIQMKSNTIISFSQKTILNNFRS